MRERILQEIQRIAKQNNGQAPGLNVFVKETGIRRSDWLGKYWARWGDALTEAGYAPNTLQSKIDTDFVLRKLAEAYRHFGRFPTEAELRMFGQNDATFPSHSTFTNHFPSKTHRHVALQEWVLAHAEFSDLERLQPEALPVEIASDQAVLKEGWVYLMQSGPNYKIGRTDDLDRRVKQIGVILPDKTEYVHFIRTDDPPGIEQYWHRRFHDKRLKGEWFKLSSADIRAFKRRKFQ